MTRRRTELVALLVLALSLAVPRAHAGIRSDPSSGFVPRVPLSAFAHSAAWFDPSRLHLVSTVSVGSGFAGGTTALQVTSLSYQFRAPFSLGVSVGNTFGLDRARTGGSPFFLEGLDLAWRPTPNALFRIEMHYYRSPLQFGRWGRGGASADPFATPY